MNSLLISLRSIARKMGVITIINRLRPPRAYEDRFHQSLKNAIRAGDVVWDVGANVGLYTELFGEWVGPTGSIIAFEPLPESAERIRQRRRAAASLHVENVALGEIDAPGELVISDDSTTNHLKAIEGETTNGSKTIPVAICRGDSICDRLGRVPNVIKIDVEGFEEEVLRGLEHTLPSPGLRGVFVEVHFHVLEMRGRRNAPARIEKLLRSCGFQTKWLDASHLKAERVSRS